MLQEQIQSKYTNRTYKIYYAYLPRQLCARRIDYPRYSRPRIQEKRSLLRQFTQYMTSTYTTLYLSYLGIALFFLYKNIALQIVIYISVNESSPLQFIRTKYDNKYPTYLLVTHVFCDHYSWYYFFGICAHFNGNLQSNTLRSNCTGVIHTKHELQNTTKSAIHPPFCTKVQRSTSVMVVAL